MFHGYLLADTVYPLAGGWRPAARRLRLGAVRLRDRTRAAPIARGSPWRRDMLGQFSIETCRPTCAIDYSFFRFTPRVVGTAGAPADVYVTEPLF